MQTRNGKVYISHQSWKINEGHDSARATKTSVSSKLKAIRSALFVLVFFSAVSSQILEYMLLLVD